MDILYKTRFLQNLLISYNELHTAEIENKTISSNFYNLEYGNEFEKYIKRISQRWWLLKDYLFSLDKIGTVFTRNFPVTDFEEMEWWQYNYENFVLRLSATLDQISKLTNEVYSFGLKEKDANWSSVRDKVKAQNSHCAECIGNLQKYLEPYIVERHIVAHCGGLASTDIKQIDNYYFDKIEIHFFGKDWYEEKELKRKEELIKLNKKLSLIVLETKVKLADILMSMEVDFEKSYLNLK